MRDLSRNNLMDDYAAKFRSRPQAIEATALRMESTALRDLLAHVASGGHLDGEAIRASVDSGHYPDLDPEWACRFARVVALHNFTKLDRTFARHILAHYVPSLSKGEKARNFKRLLVELLLDAGEYGEASAVLRRSPGLRELQYGYLATDLCNPFTASPYADRHAWLDGVNRVFDASELDRIEVPEFGPGAPINRVATGAPRRYVEGPMVSVVMTAWRPDRLALLSSLRSVLGQTWADLEVVLVDDASGEQYDEVFEEAARLAPEVRLVRSDVNAGTYEARNLGLKLARGTYITGQDSDDWSHPRRIERQVAALVATDGAVASMSRGLNMLDDMQMHRPGYGKIVTDNASSILVKVDTAREVGGFLSMRRAADTEFRMRVESYTGSPTVRVDDPLAIINIAPDSLSRGDFRASWSHPARRAFRSSYLHWHQTAERNSLKVGAGSLIPLNVPPRLGGESHSELDVVYAGDWRHYGGPQKSMLEEISAALEGDLRVGVLHLEAARFMVSRTQPLCAPVQELINSGAVTQVLEDDELRPDLLILRYPPILQFPSAFPSKIRPRRLLIVANQAPAERDGTDIRYLPDACTRAAEGQFGVRPVWVPQSPVIRETLTPVLPADDLADFDMPGILESSKWVTDRTYRRSTRPVIGRHSRDNVMKWPTGATLRAAYPVDADVDVRIMGGARFAFADLGLRRPPTNWTVLEADAMDVRAFLNSIDFFVYYQHENAYDAFGRAVLEALSTGCVVLLPDVFEPIYGDAAIYASPGEVMDLVRDLYGDWSRYKAQSDLAVKRVAEKFSHEAYVQRLSALVGVTETAATTAVSYGGMGSL